LPIEHYILQTEISSRKKDDWNQELTTYQKLDQPSGVVPIAKNIDIAGLPSNTYRVSVRLIDAKKKIWLERSAIFVQSNPYRDSIVQEKLLSGELNNFFDTVENERVLYSLRALAMKLGGQEQETINNMIQKDDYESMKDYLFRYWIGEDPIQPQLAYRDFMRMIDAIDQKFYSGFRNGFETDRGMIYLRYGPPMRIITRENDQGAVPYEIWTYDRVDMYNQVDVKFVFYNPNIAGDQFQLLHSNARNEVRNPQWLTEIYNIGDQFDGPNSVDARGVQDNYQREAARIFNDN
jgi:GWxTD domain-containing protein